MLIFGSIENAVAGKNRRYFTDAPKFRGHTDFMFESPPGDPLGPQAFLVHQDPGWVLPVHFHMQFQMQVVVGGSGTLGRRPIGPGTVHFAAPHSAYGPITAGPDGLEYFTIRSLTDRGAWYMPESRPWMDTARRKEQATGQAWSIEPHAQDCNVLEGEDGLGAWAYRGAAGREMRCNNPIGSTGRFHIVLHGSFRLGNAQLTRHGVVYWNGAGESPVFESLEDGSELIVAQLPGRALANFVSPEGLAGAPQQPSTTNPRPDDLPTAPIA